MALGFQGMNMSTLPNMLNIVQIIFSKLWRNFIVHSLSISLLYFFLQYVFLVVIDTHLITCKANDTQQAIYRILLSYFNILFFTFCFVALSFDIFFANLFGRRYVSILSYFVSKWLQPSNITPNIDTASRCQCEIKIDRIFF